MTVKHSKKNATTGSLSQKKNVTASVTEPKNIVFIFHDAHHGSTTHTRRYINRLSSGVREFHLGNGDGAR